MTLSRPVCAQIGVVSSAKDLPCEAPNTSAKARPPNAKRRSLSEAVKRRSVGFRTKSVESIPSPFPWPLGTGLRPRLGAHLLMRNGPADLSCVHMYERHCCRRDRLFGRLRTVTRETPAAPDGKETVPRRRFPRSRVGTAERARMREEVREVEFPIALRGYDRAAVDRYVQKVNRLIADFEISSSPESAIRHALEEVSEETSGLLQHAYETADEITARSRSKADDRLQRAEREAEEIRE